MEGGQQKLNYDFIIKYGIEPIYNDINDKFAGGKLPELNSELESKIKSELESKIKSESESDTESEAKSDTELNPILGYITETMIKYLNMPNLASIVSSFNIFCSMMSYNETMSSIQSAASSASSSASSSAASSASNDDEKTEFVSTDKPTNISRKRIPEFKPDRKEEEMRRSFEGLPNTISKNAAAAAAAGGKHRTRRKHSKQKKRETQKKRPAFNAAYRVAKKSNKKSRKNLI